jgi:CRP-like cAMP-binding protein
MVVTRRRPGSDEEEGCLPWYRVTRAVRLTRVREAAANVRAAKPALTPESVWQDSPSVETTRITAFPVFADLPAEELDELAAAVSEAETDEGATIVSVDDYGTSIYFIEEGQAVVLDEEGEAIEALGPGDTFGEIGLLLTGQRTATVVGRTPMRLLSLSGGDFERIRARVPEVERSLRRLGVERARR